MKTTVQLARISGIPLRIHLNWLITAVLVVWSLGAGYYPYLHPEWSTPTYWWLSVITAALFFGSVLLHEFGHALVSQREGVPVQSITLFVLGGVAHIAHEPDTPRAEFRIVAAGPLVSIVLALVFYLVSEISFLPMTVISASHYLSRINIILSIFNLIPGFPLDGGRLLRSLLWGIFRDFRRATRWATNFGLSIAVLFVGVGVFFMFSGNIVGGLWVAFVGGYLGFVARGAQQITLKEAPADPAAQRRAMSTPAYPWTLRVPQVYWPASMRREKPEYDGELAMRAIWTDSIPFSIGARNQAAVSRCARHYAFSLRRGTFAAGLFSQKEL